MFKYDMNCPLAEGRLAIGIAATVLQAKDNDAGKTAQQVMQVTSDFITLLDTLRLGALGVEEVHPLVRDIVSNLSHFPGSCPTGSDKFTEWLKLLNGMKAADEITEEQST